MERGAMAGSVNAIPGRNSAFETGGVQASDGPEHAVSWSPSDSVSLPLFHAARGEGESEGGLVRKCALEKLEHT